MTLSITPLQQPLVSAAPVEMVERKGLGHPDTLCDGLAEAFALALANFYMERFGVVLHHNVDKVLLWGGAGRPHFGGGEVTAPMELYLSGRATREFKGVEVPVAEIAEATSRAWLRRQVRHLDVERHVRIHCLVRASSSDLTDLFVRGQQQGGYALANDTSCGAGYAPLSPLERAVLEVEQSLNSEAVKALHPEQGEDIKVMAVRAPGELALTVSCAMVDRHITDRDDYYAKKAALVARVRERVGLIDGIAPQVAANTADGDTPASLYLTVTGTSAESGDDGQVGRGNRINGLITPYRPMTIEAAAGKNPVTHVGKLYNAAAMALADRLVREIEEVEEAYCWLVSRIGQRVDQPQAVDVRVRLKAGAVLPQARITEVVEAQLRGLDTLWRDWLRGERRIC